MRSTFRWGTLLAILLLLLAGMALFLWRPRAQPDPLRLDPSKIVVNIALPILTLTTEEKDAYVLPDLIVVPRNGVIRITGKFRHHSKVGHALMVGETQIAGAQGQMVMTGNGVTPIPMKANHDCEYVLLVYQPPAPQPTARLEIKVGDEFLATGRVVVSP